MEDRTLEIERWVGNEEEEVKVSIRSPRERDVSIPHNAEDLILTICRVMGWSVSVNKEPDHAEVDPGV